MADIYQVTLRNKETGEELTREYDLDYVDAKNKIVFEMWLALQKVSTEEVKF